MTNYIINTVFGPAVRVFEVTTILKNKDTGKYRVADSKRWCWAKTIEDATALMMAPYLKSNVDDKYLEEVSVSLQAVELVGQPNPANISDMEKGDAFEFTRGKPGILLNMWGYPT
jgi:hypothetical protein